MLASVIWKLVAPSTCVACVPGWIGISKVTLPDLTRYAVVVIVSERWHNLPLPLLEWTLMAFAFNYLAITESEAYDGGEFELIVVIEVWGKLVSTEGEEQHNMLVVEGGDDATTADESCDGTESTWRGTRDTWWKGVNLRWRTNRCLDEKSGTESELLYYSFCVEIQ